MTGLMYILMMEESAMIILCVGKCIQISVLFERSAEFRLVYD